MTEEQYIILDEMREECTLGNTWKFGEFWDGPEDAESYAVWGIGTPTINGIYLVIYTDEFGGEVHTGEFKGFNEFRGF